MVTLGGGWLPVASSSHKQMAVQGRPIFMKKIRLFAFIMTLALLVTSCGAAGSSGSQSATVPPASAAASDSSTPVSDKGTAPAQAGSSGSVAANENSTPVEDASGGPALSTDHKKPSERISILYTNDMHCALDQNLGMKSVAAIKNTLKDLGMPVLLVDAGDAVQGDVIGALSKGDAIIQVMNKVGYDVVIPGNHEFDYGMDQFKHFVETADFPYICCNLVDASGKTLLPPSLIKEVAGVKIGFVGITTPQTLSSSSPNAFKDKDGKFIYSFMEDKTGQKLYQTVQKAVDKVREQGADYVVAIGHLGIAAESSPWMSTQVIENTNGIDVLVDGHSHTLMPRELVKNKDGKQVILTQTQTKLTHIGLLTIDIDAKLNTQMIDDGGTYKAIQEQEKAIKKKTEAVVGHTDYDLAVIDPKTDHRMVRSNETNLGDFCADAFRVIGKADIGFMNGGGIRDEIKKGDITYGDLVAVFPFSNELCVAEVSGQDILDALEMGAMALPGEDGGFLQVSGIHYKIDLSVKSPVKVNDKGEFVGVDGPRRVKDVYVGDRPIDPTKTYKLASHNYFLKQGGSGFTMLTGHKLILDGGVPDILALTEYLDQLGGKIPDTYKDVYGDGRVVIEPGN